MLALVFVAVTVGVAVALRRAEALPPLLAELFEGGLVIAGWVAVWRPIDLLLYEPWLLRREARVLAAIARMTVSVTALTRGGPSDP